jgi:hypothetical protein
VSESGVVSLELPQDADRQVRLVKELFAVSHHLQQQRALSVELRTDLDWLTEVVSTLRPLNHTRPDAYRQAGAGRDELAWGRLYFPEDISSERLAEMESRLADIRALTKRFAN